MPEQESGSNLLGISVGKGRGRTIGRIIKIADKLYQYGKVVPLFEETRRLHRINNKLYTIAGIIPTVKN